MKGGVGVTMVKDVKKQVWMSRDEAAKLKEMSASACMSEANFIRMLISGYAPRPAPDDKFYEAMELLKDMGDKLENLQIGVSDPELRAKLEHESEKWHIFQHAIEQRYLLPERSDV